ncbi:hypothetical protein G9A89_000981 [Geosiphon pyriformis]|nr:hypothetical protein G9A89_000981 [Geosiphon pyriformis]
METDLCSNIQVSSVKTTSILTTTGRLDPAEYSQKIFMPILTHESYLNEATTSLSRLPSKQETRSISDFCIDDSSQENEFMSNFSIKAHFEDSSPERKQGSSSKDSFSFCRPPIDISKILFQSYESIPFLHHPTSIHQHCDHVTFTEESSLSLTERRELARKISHSAIERRRRERINEKILQLQKMVPCCANQQHIHKLTILQGAIDYINYLQGLLAEKQNQNTHGINEGSRALDDWKFVKHMKLVSYDSKKQTSSPIPSFERENSDFPFDSRFPIASKTPIKDKSPFLSDYLKISSLCQDKETFCHHSQMPTSCTFSCQDEFSGAQIGVKSLQSQTSQNQVDNFSSNTQCKSTDLNKNQIQTLNSTSKRLMSVKNLLS